MSAPTGAAGVAGPTPRRRGVLVVSTDPLTDRMPGPAIRAWHLAEVLADALAPTHDVVLAGTAGVTRDHPRMAVVSAEHHRRPALLAEADVVVAPAGVLHEWPEIETCATPLVVDLYDPYHLENLEPPAGEGEETTPAGRDRTVVAMSRAIDRHLVRGDFFLCASERQRDFWIGSLASLGRVNPYTYDADPGLGRLIAVVPFGLSGAPPQRQGPGMRGHTPGIEAGDHVVLWAGGVYNWFDPLSLVHAVDRLRHRLTDVRLVFLGMAHPNPAVPAMRAAAETREMAAALGLTDRHVFFNEGWVPYDRRADYLLDADVGVSTHLDHIEARYSFRTRVLDYLWASLPTVLTEGDVLADLVAAEGLGTKVAAGDVAAIEVALGSALTGRGTTDPARFAAVVARYRWERVAVPLVDYCRSPVVAPDRAGRVPTTAAGVGAIPAGADPGTPWARDAAVLGRRLVSGLRRRVGS